MPLTEKKFEVVWESSCCAQWKSAVAELNQDIGENLPQLAGKIANAVYEPVQKAIRLKKGRNTIYVYPGKIYIPYINDEEEGKQLMAWARKVINHACSKVESATREH